MSFSGRLARVPGGEPRRERRRSAMVWMGSRSGCVVVVVGGVSVSA